MRGIIFHAGRTGGPYQVITPENAAKPLKEQLSFTNFGWPPDSKPKCLFHMHGETLLKRTVMLFREVGVEQIRIVAGYKKELIEEHNNKEKLGLEIVYNPDWDYDYSYLRPGQPGQDYLKGMKTVELGLDGMDDALLMTYGDALMMRKAVKEAVETKLPLAMATPHLFKIDRSHLHLLKELPNYGGGTGVYLPLRQLFVSYADMAESWHPIGKNPICYMLSVRGFGVCDVDYYNQTDEYKKERCLALRSQGLSFEEIAEKAGITLEWTKMLCLEDGYPLHSPVVQPECKNCNVQLEKTKNCEFRENAYGILCPRERTLKRKKRRVN